LIEKDSFMDISNRFSLVDFLAYLFPGILSVLGIYAALQVPFFEFPEFDLLSAPLAIVVLFVFGYILGVVLAGFSETILREWRKTRNRSFPKDRIPLPGLEAEVVHAYQSLFGLTKPAEFQWSATHYYLCRALVMKYMPENAQSIERQIALRQMRMNLIPTVLIWALVGTLWGIFYAWGSSPVLGFSLLVSTVVLTTFIILTLLNRMDSNERRETREVLASFLAGYKTSLFARETARPNK
jgi:hypothetical protein